MTKKCRVCRTTLPYQARGSPRKYCSDECQKAGQNKLTILEAAALMGKVPNTVRRDIRVGKLPAMLIRNKYFIDESNLSQYRKASKKTQQKTFSDGHLVQELITHLEMDLDIARSKIEEYQVELDRLMTDFESEKWHKDRLEMFLEFLRS